MWQEVDCIVRCVYWNSRDAAQAISGNHSVRMGAVSRVVPIDSYAAMVVAEVVEVLLVGIEGSSMM